jgi:hypothetical protein
MIEIERERGEREICFEEEREVDMFREREREKER